MGILYLLVAMTLVVTAALYKVITRVYSPKHRSTPPPPKEPKIKKSKKEKSGGGRGYKIKRKQVQLKPAEKPVGQDAEEGAGSSEQINGDSGGGTTAVNSPEQTNSPPSGELEDRVPATNDARKPSSPPNSELGAQTTAANAPNQPTAAANNELDDQLPIIRALDQPTSTPNSQTQRDPATSNSDQPASTQNDASEEYYTAPTGDPWQVVRARRQRPRRARPPPHPAPACDSSATRASDQSSQPQTLPTPPAEFIPIFSLVEPGNIDQTVSLTTLAPQNQNPALRQLPEPRTARLRLPPATATSPPATWRASSSTATAPSSGLRRRSGRETRT